MRITLAWIAAGCPWSLEKCGLRACLTFTKITFFSRCQMQTVPFLLCVKEPPFWCIGKCGYTWPPRSVGLLQADASFRERSKFKWFGREDKRCPFAMPLPKDYIFAPP